MKGQYLSACPKLRAQIQNLETPHGLSTLERFEYSATLLEVPMVPLRFHVLESFVLTRGSARESRGQCRAELIRPHRRKAARAPNPQQLQSLAINRFDEHLLRGLQ